MAFLVLSSCSATQPLQPVPALLIQPLADSRVVLEKVIGDLLNSQSIKLADNVFIHNSNVIIERSQPKDSRGNLLDGREARPADTFSLLTENEKCYVRHDQSGTIKLVDNITCTAK